MVNLRRGWFILTRMQLAELLLSAAANNDDPVPEETAPAHVTGRQSCHFRRCVTVMLLSCRLLHKCIATVLTAAWTAAVIA